jgi:hypothetical protein
MQFDNKTRNPESRGRPPTGSIERNAMFALARDGTRWQHNLNATKGADRVVQLGRMLPLPEASHKVQDEVVIHFVLRRAYTIGFPEIEHSWIPGSGYRFYSSGFKDPPERKGLGYYVLVEKPPNKDFQSFGFAYYRKGKLITPGMRKFISGFRREGLRFSRDWVNITCTGEYLWKPDRDNYTSSISALYQTVWRMDCTDRLIIMQDPDSLGIVAVNVIIPGQPAKNGTVCKQLE